jgi:hypothetical protein
LRRREKNMISKFFSRLFEAINRYLGQKMENLFGLPHYKRRGPKEVFRALRDRRAFLRELRKK